MYSVMIVDDYEVYRKTLRAMAVWGDVSGFVITVEAANGREALQKLLQKPVDLLLTDIRMPVVDGLELIKKAMAQSLCGCIVIMSQFSDFEYARKGLSSGALDYLLKPVDPGELANVLGRAAAHINEKRLQNTRMSYLENILDKSAEQYFPQNELDAVANLLTEGSAEALEAAAQLVSSAYSELNLDSAKTVRVLNRAVKRLAETVRSDFPWIEKFFDLRVLSLGDVSLTAEPADLKELFVGKVRAVLSVIRKYELGIDSSSMARLACKTILENIDTDITISELSNRLFITRTYLSEVFREKTGITLVRYLTEVKIERAKVLISHGGKSVEIAELLGYNDEEYFKKLFKKITGISISEFRSAVTGG